MKYRLSGLLDNHYVSIGMMLALLLCVCLLIGLAFFAVTTFSVAPTYPESSAIVEEQSFAEYVGLVNITFRFMTTIMGILVAALILTVVLLGLQLYVWSQDRRTLNNWQNIGFVVERLDFLPGNRLRINNFEIELNRVQFNTLRELAQKRLDNETLHPSELPGDNGTQMIKRLREEMGGRLIEKSLIKSRRGKGYWADISPEKITINTDDDE